MAYTDLVPLQKNLSFFYLTLQRHVFTFKALDGTPVDITGFDDVKLCFASNGDFLQDHASIAVKSDLSFSTPDTYMLLDSSLGSTIMGTGKSNTIVVPYNLLGRTTSGDDYQVLAFGQATMQRGVSI